MSGAFTEPPFSSWPVLRLLAPPSSGGPSLPATWAIPPVLALQTSLATTHGDRSTRSDEWRGSTLPRVTGPMGARPARRPASPPQLIENFGGSVGDDPVDVQGQAELDVGRAVDREDEDPVVPLPEPLDVARVVPD